LKLGDALGGYKVHEYSDY